MNDHGMVEYRRVELHTAEGEPIESILVPTADAPTEEAAIAEARAAHRILSTVRGNTKPADVAWWLQSLEDAGVFPLLAKAVRRMANATVDVEIAPDPDDDTPSDAIPAGKAALRRRIGRIARFTFDSPDTRREFAEYAGVHTQAWAVMEVRDQLAAEGLNPDTITAEEFDRRFQAVWASGGFIGGAISRCFHLYSEDMARMLVDRVSGPDLAEGVQKVFDRVADRFRQHRFSPGGGALAAPTRDVAKAPRHRFSESNHLGAYARFPADRINKGAIEGYARMGEWQPVDGFFRGIAVATGAKFRQTIGFRTDPGETLWNFLLTRGEAAIKAHYALWARCYETTGAEPGKYIVLNVPQFCEDLGYAKHHKGGFRREHKREAVQILYALTTAELSVEFAAGPKIRRLRGPLWQRGVEADERDQYADLFGSARVGEPTLWDPVKFSYAPGQWFEDPEWRRRNKYVGLIGSGLLKLDNRNDRWAIRIGGFYGTIARIEQYRTRTISVLTVLKKTGLGDLRADHPSRQEESFQRAHERLVAVGVLKHWDWDMEPVEEPDMDDQDDIATLRDFDPGDWRRRRVILTWPDVMTQEERPRLEAAEKRAVARATRKGAPRSHRQRSM